jgi:tellurite resistance protein
VASPARVPTITGDEVRGSRVSASVVLELLGDEEDVDDVRDGLASTSVWVASLIASSDGSSERTEGLLVAVISECGLRH